MEHEGQPDFEAIAAEEVGNKAEVERQLTIESLPAALGLVETPEMIQLHGQLVEAIAAESDEISELVGQYRQRAVEIIEQLQDDAYGRAQVGLTVMMAVIRRDGGRVDYYLEELEEAATQAWGLGYHDLLPVIDAAMAAAQSG